MKRRKTWASLLLILLLAAAAAWFWNWTPEILDGTVVTRTGMITDRAMSDGRPYLSLELEDGSTVLCWNLYETEISEEVTVGSRVEITYGIEEAHHRNVVLDIDLLQ